jgi:predicted nucleic acid-binding protein
LIVLDANILIRAVLGRRARYLIDTFQERVSLIVADTAVAEARWHLSELAVERRLDPKATAELLEKLLVLTEIIGPELYSPFGDSALERLSRRDPDDWPSLALCMALDCPIWTEDRDFFGVGIATWTTEHVEIFLKQQVSAVD